MDLITLVGLNGLSAIVAFGQYLIVALLLVGAVLSFLPGRTVREETTRSVVIFGWTLSIQKTKPKTERVQMPNTFSKKLEVYSFLKEFEARPPALALQSVRAGTMQRTKSTLRQSEPGRSTMVGNCIQSPDLS